jgi:signal transduction histidine kinase
MSRDPAPVRFTEAWPSWARGRWADAEIAVVVGVLQIAGTIFASRHQTGRSSLDVLAYTLLAAGPLALLWRRRHPAAVLVVVFATTLAYWVSDYPRGPVFFALIVAFLTAVMAGLRIFAIVVVVAGWVAFTWLPYLVGNESEPSPAATVGLLAWLLVLSAIGEIARVSRERAAERTRSREEEALRRASEERLRIARELHDVLAHNISLINVQAGVALHLMDEQPAQARTALTAIRHASKDALSELRSVLEVLRLGEAPPRTSERGLDDLDGVVSRAAAAGLSVQVDVEGEHRPLPAEVDLAAFRIVQEAVTNVARHAGQASATVRVAYGERDLTIQVDDDGGGAMGAISGGGSGIAGMRERTAALGGRLDAGPRPGGGFRVRAQLPVDGVR